MAARFVAAPVLERLKDFQRGTVDYVFRRLYEDGAPAARFLVADEVGLGKTLVARGVIAKALEYLQDRVKRIDVVYVCSNSSIATQNIQRLQVSGTSEFALASRLTLLPLHVRHLKDNKVNFVSFTPGTSFDLRSRGGLKKERALLYRLLCDEQQFDRHGLLHLLQGTAGWEGWKDTAENGWLDIDCEIAERFRTVLRADRDLTHRLRACTERLNDRRRRIDAALQDKRYRLIGELRQTLAHVCLDALEPDLVILDEFQRFRDLLDGQSPAAELARALFSYPGVRVLLLSATPYKMLSLDHEAEDDHYPDFLRTLDFLLDNDGSSTAISDAVQAYRRALLGIEGEGSESALAAKRHLEGQLRPVMCRTERVALTRQRDAMLIEPPMVSDLRPQDLRQARLADTVAREGGAPDVVEYWKSSPYLLSFARHYKLRDTLQTVAADPSDRVLERFAEDAASLLRIEDLDRYAPCDPANPRMRSLYADTLDRGLWRVLWMPPSLPYWRPQGFFAEVGDITKALVFSSWNMVPDAIAALCSYEAERRVMEGRAESPSRTDLYARLRPLLRFSRDHASGRLTGMPALAVMMPSPALAALLDPLALALELATDPTPVDLDTLLRLAQQRLSEALAPLLAQAATEGREDERWYWAAPVLLDYRAGNRLVHWCRDPDGWCAIGAGARADDADTGFDDHVAQLIEAAEGRLDPPLGPPPADLTEVLAELALAGPGVCALRALWRITGGLESDDPTVLSAASVVARGFRSLFNVPESIALLRGTHPEESYWRLVLRHGLDGNLQALLDEQVHVLQESLGVADSAVVTRVEEVAWALEEALSIRTAQLVVDQVKPAVHGRALEITPFRLRCRFALRFGELKDESDQTLSRAETVRLAFNSPFRPFVLASTSIGQEGLDFHTWCHAVVHWNLPSNPVDLEQREGRVHRYKGHAVRKNIVRAYGLPALRAAWDGQGDPWQRMFELANRDKPPGTSDLVPYWIFEHPQGAAVERRIPLVSFSRDAAQLMRLKTGLALYRLVFGQPRQEDLLTFLGQSSRTDQADLDHLILDLAPIEEGV